jgi:hypothetical protein
LDSTSATPGALNKGDEGLPREAARNFQILAQLPFGCCTQIDTHAQMIEASAKTNTLRKIPPQKLLNHELPV